MRSLRRTRMARLHAREARCSSPGLRFADARRRLLALWRRLGRARVGVDARRLRKRPGVHHAARAAKRDQLARRGDVRRQQRVSPGLHLAASASGFLEQEKTCMCAVAYACTNANGLKFVPH